MVKVVKNLGRPSMRFKSIEVTGFKSFADRTKIIFQPGITAIVGPNGCGKSNVSDAIRWVLGEQSAKQIRGERMEDVIFNGTRSRAPMGMAEVTLVVSDLDAGIASDFAAFDEIQITRRYYRSGESEYLINRIPCRLMDIRELFMDTGMGGKAYSIIGQGNISAILNAKPKERRFLFEEAAGITKYKARKDEALRKLDRTRDNLSRVRDIIAEVTRQRNSLNRQAKKAERYKKFKDEIREVDLHLSSRDFSSMRHEWDGLQEEYRVQKDREAEILSLTSAKETHIEELELEVLDREKSLSELHDEIHNIDSQISREENRIQVLTSDITHLNDLCVGSNREIERLETEIGTSRSATALLEQELQTLTQKSEEKTVHLQEKEAELSSLLTTKQEEEAELEAEKEHLSQLMRQIGVQKNRMENAGHERDSLLEMHDGYDSNYEACVNQLAEKKNRLSEKTENLSGLKASIHEIRSGQEAILSDLEQKQEELSSVLDRTSRLREQMGQESSRLDTLAELQENLDGYDEGIRSLIQPSSDSSEPGVLPPFHTLVGDIFETDPRFEVAIESVISDRYQSLVVDGPEDSLRAVSYLKDQQIGRGAFIPLHPKNPKLDPFCRKENTGTVGEALSLVHFDPQFAGVAQYLLGDVVVMENLEQAIALYRSNGFHRTLVTLSGDVLDPSGAVEGGARKKNTSGFIRRKREIRELKVSMEVLKAYVSKAEGERQDLNHRISQIKQDLNETSARLQERDDQRVELEKEVASLEHEVNHLRERLDGLSNENQSRSNKLLALQESIVAYRHELTQLEEEQESRNEKISTISQRVQSVREQIEQQRMTVTEERVHLASIKEKKVSLLTHIEKNRMNSENLKELILGRRREIEEAQSRIEKSEEAKTETESRIHSLMETKEEVHTRTVEEQGIYDMKREELHNEQKNFKELRVENEKLNRKLNDLEVRRTELSIKKEHLTTKIREKYQVSLQDVLPNFVDREINDEEARQRLDELSRKIDQMGPVNIMAIEEYNALQERFEFLTTQEADLQESVESLMSAIRKINRTSRQRFLDSFDAINEKFKVVFHELFQGGQAELKLEDGQDILDAGVEVIAQPPGKKLQHLTLLSGGEKALTAVALIFAGFLVKPSPFCLLDEVDAPLDDLNVERYNAMLKRLTQNTQYIVITHNKNSMEHSDALYGITMQEAGISRMVSVLFNDGQEAKLSA